MADRFITTTYTSLENIAQQWDGLLPTNHTLKSANLIALENSTSVATNYVLIKNNDELIGCIYLQKVIFNQDDLSVSSQKICNIENLVKSLLWISCDLSIWVVGNLFRTSQQGFYFKTNIPNETIFDIIEQLKLKSAGVLIKESEIELNTSKSLPLDFKLQGNDFTMVQTMQPEWETLQDYKNSLSKKYRKRFEKIRKQGETLQFKELNLSEIVENQKNLFDLYKQVVAQQNVKLGEIKSNYFVAMKMALQENFKIIGVYTENNLVAFSSHIFTKSNTHEMHYIGIDYQQNENYALYFNLLFNGLELTIIRKLQKLELGRTAHVAKASMGAVEVKQNNYIYLKRGVAKFGFWVLNKYFLTNNETELKSRNPFKEA